MKTKTTLFILGLCFSSSVGFAQYSTLVLSVFHPTTSTTDTMHIAVTDGSTGSAQINYSINTGDSIYITHEAVADWTVASQNTGVSGFFHFKS